MQHAALELPSGYWSKLDVIQTEAGIKLVKDTFERELARALHLTRVSAPLFVRADSGLNDTLGGWERPVSFDIRDIPAEVEIVQSLAKWKRLALARYGFESGTGLYTDMNAIRRDETLDNLHSVYVDQWDWERVIRPEDRTLEFLKSIVSRIMHALSRTQVLVRAEFPALSPVFPERIAFLTSQELEDMYPDLPVKDREDKAAEKHGAVLIMQIGDALQNGKPHDDRAPDYDDWALNGDILVWYPLLSRAIEVSSMGIRVDAQSLSRQLQKAGVPERRELPFHKRLLEGSLPLTIGGGIGQSRLCMMMLEKAHIGEVQASVWSEEMIRICEENGIHLL